MVGRRTPELEIKGSNLQECRLVLIEQNTFGSPKLLVHYQESDSFVPT